MRNQRAPVVILAVPVAAEGTARGGQAVAGRLLWKVLRTRLTVRLIPMPLRTPGRRNTPARLASKAVAILKVVSTALRMKLRGPVIVQIFTPCNKSAFFEKAILAWLLGICGAHAIISFRSSFDLRYPRWGRASRWGARQLLRGVSGVTVQYSQLRSFLYAEKIVPPGTPVAVIPNGVSLPTGKAATIRREGRSSGRAVRFTFLGTVRQSKGVDVLLDAIEKMLNRERDRPVPVEFVIAGPEFEPALEKRVARLATSARRSGGTLTLRRLPPVDDEEKWQLLRDSHVLVLPSRDEGFPNVVLEAMGSGCALVVTPVGALMDLMASGEYGQVVPVGDADALATALETAASDREGLELMGGLASAAAKRLFTPGSVGDLHAEFYRELLAPAPMANAPVESVD